MKHIFITGTESFVGRELVRQCDACGIEVSGIDLVAGDRPSFYKGDARDSTLADFIPDNVDAVVHLAALSRDPDCRERAYACFDANVMGTLNVIEAAKAKNARQLIFASSEWVYDQFEAGEIKTETSFVDIANLTSEYALSKLVSEANLRQQYHHGFCPVTILRFGIIYGPRKQNWSAVEAMFHGVATKDELQIGSLKTGRHFIHVSDIASAIVQSVDKDGFQLLNIQGDKLLTLGDIIEESKKILQKDVRVVETDADNPSIKCVSNDKAKEVLGWMPAVGVNAGLLSVKDFLQI